MGMISFEGPGDAGCSVAVGPKTISPSLLVSQLTILNTRPQTPTGLGLGKLNHSKEELCGKTFKGQKMVSRCFKVNLYSPASRRRMEVGTLTICSHRAAHGKRVWAGEMQVSMTSKYRWWDFSSRVGWCVW